MTVLMVVHARTVSTSGPDFPERRYRKGDVAVIYENILLSDLGITEREEFYLISLPGTFDNWSYLLEEVRGDNGELLFVRRYTWKQREFPGDVIQSMDQRHPMIKDRKKLQQKAGRLETRLARVRSTVLEPRNRTRIYNNLGEVIYALDKIDVQINDIAFRSSDFTMPHSFIDVDGKTIGVSPFIRDRLK